MVLHVDHRQIDGVRLRQRQRGVQPAKASPQHHHPAARPGGNHSPSVALLCHPSHQEHRGTGGQDGQHGLGG